ncbi:MAG: sigma-54-dependent Fis family transcriptional regulator, partial [Deltaproteobacteria bacterium]
MKSILIVDDERNVHYSFKKIFSPEFKIISAYDASKAITNIKRGGIDLVMMDIRLPGMDGLQALSKIKEINKKLPVVMMTGYGTMHTAIEAMKLGAYEYIIKPFDAPRIMEVAKKALSQGDLMRKVTYLSPREKEGGDRIVGFSAPMQEVFKRIGQTAEKDVTVLIRGESGTGKELIARAIYQNSLRADKPFLAVNSAAIPDTLLESELFGHEKGSFTGADERRIGRFEQAHKGTIFLDEIGNMSLTTQAKVLRIIQDGEFSRLGGKETIKVDVRLLAATNMDMDKAIKKGSFREDLYYRLNVISIELPPLRERREDVPELTKYFLERYSEELGREGVTMSNSAMKILEDYSWPGNVRELENCIKRAVILAKSDVIMPEDLQIPTVKEEGGTLEDILGKALDNVFLSRRGVKVMPEVERI